MQFHFSEGFLEGDSQVHRLDARTKIVLTVAFIATVALFPFGAFWLYGSAFLLVVAVAAGAQLGPWFVIKRSFVALPFALAAITLPFTVPGVPLVVIPTVFGPITVSLEGTIRALSIIMKSWISVQMAILLVATTPFQSIVWGLRQLHVPHVLVAIVSFTYRYLSVLGDEVQRMSRAHASRSAALPGKRSGGSILWRGKVAGYMVGSLMLRSFERSERIYHAMAARGYRGEMRALGEQRLSRQDVIALVAGLALLVSMLMISTM